MSETMWTNEKCPNCDGRGTESDGADCEEVECWQCKVWRKITVSPPTTSPIDTTGQDEVPEHVMDTVIRLQSKNMPDLAEEALRESRKWEHIHKAADEVATWPDWKKGYKPASIATTQGDECSASDSGCSYGPHGPNGAIQCRWCGEPKPAPQAEGFEEWWLPFLIDKDPGPEAIAAKFIAKSAWSAAQAPLLQKIGELEAIIEIQKCECDPSEACELFQRARKAKARIAELEAQILESKAEHGNTLLSLHKAAFETIPALESRISELESALAQSRKREIVHRYYVPPTQPNADDEEMDK